MFVLGGKFWFNRKTAAKQFNVKHQPYCYAGTITNVTSNMVYWQWDYDSSSRTTMRRTDLLIKQQPQVVTDAQQRFLDADPTYTLANVSFLLTQGYQPTDSAVGGPSPLRYSIVGFKNAGNTTHWHSVIRWVQFDFDPAQFLVRRINSEAPPKGKAQKLWSNCAQALTQLLQHQVQRDDTGAYVPDRLFDQLTMLARCLQILLLRVPPRADSDFKGSIIIRNCQRFLNGHWRSLATTAHEELTVCNILAARPRAQDRPIPPPQEASKHQHVLARARALHYSKAMNLLRSPGLATQSPTEVTAALADLHPRLRTARACHRHANAAAAGLPHYAVQFCFH